MSRDISISALFLWIMISANAEARDPHQVLLFRKAHPCPATNKISGACPGWVVDHIVPLCWGGVDAPGNMQWQGYVESKIKDKFEVEACDLKIKCGVK